ncbi:WASH complex subunit 2C-like isoform X4 [Oncorhynchus keta]|uniref:WASH complex subunit 2C-like isoform X4 n=1 Tax=Oncorhynchus keta TaxID=8018 RepID=UPI0015F7BF77|nr:WASH complex subunit 2C-like isoform X4 [Oncorhynchus keta]
MTFGAHISLTWTTVFTTVTKMSGLLVGMANVPSKSNHTGKDGQVWERLWTLEEMRQTSANWSLAADSGLFLFLQEFSQRMLSKTHEIEKQLDGLIRDTKATDCCMHTVFNDFLMLSNTQFIENRVYDDDDEEVEEAVPKPEALERLPEQKTREQKEAQLIPKVQEAVNYGLMVLDSAFEQLDIKAGNSDSEDEEATDRVEPILEPKDLYVDRPLPYLIGSQLFMGQEDVGLGDLSSEEMSVDSDRDTVIVSEDGKDANLSMLSDDEEGDSDIFGESDEDDDDDDDDRKSLCHIQNPRPSSFADELAARIKGEPISKPEGDRTSVCVVADEDDSEELLGPSKMEDEDFSPFGGKGGHFSRGRGLFDDEGDLFSDPPKQPVAEKKTTEPVKPAKKIPSGAVPIFPENSLFGTPNDSDSVEGRENGSPAKPIKTQTSAPRKTALGGLFDDEEDHFFTGESLNKSSSAGQEESKQKKTVDLFGGGDEDGDIFSESSGVLPPLQSRREVVEEEEQMPADVSMFGPVTKTLLTETLKKQRPSTSEESEEICPTIPKSQSKLEPTLQSKALLSIFVDEEDEDLFVSAKKSKSSQTEDATPQVKKPVSRAVFSDDEDHWMSSKHSAGKTGGMKSSDSNPYRLPSVKADPFDSLFDDDDLFAATKEFSSKKPQRASLLFEDETEDGEDKGSLFVFKPAINNSSTLADPKAAAVASPGPSRVHTDKPEDVTAPPPPVEKRRAEERAAKGPEVQPLSSLLECSESKKKPVGAVSLFGGINVLGDRLGAAKQTKSPLDETDGDDFLSEGPPPMEKGSKKNNTVSLFDDEEGADWTDPIYIPSKTATINTLKPAEERPHTKSSTGVFQDEELLFSHTQQRDNHPDVDIFATPDKFVRFRPSNASSSVKSRPSSVRSAAPTPFSDEDEDDLFSSVNPKALRPKVSAKPSKPVKDEPSPQPSVTEPVTGSETNLVINPDALLLGLSPSSSGLSPSPAWTQSLSNGGLSFDRPVQVSVLQCANKGRAKGSIRRRPQTRAARQMSAQSSVDQKNQGEDPAGHSPTLPHPTQPSLALLNPIEPSLALSNLTLPRPSLPNQAPTTGLPSFLPASLPSQPPLTYVSVTPSVLTLPVSNTPLKRDFSMGSKVKVLPSPDEADRFGSVPVLAPVPKLATKTTEGELTPKEEKEATPPSVFDDPMGDLFQKVKPRSAKTFLEEEDEEDIFVLGNSSTPTTRITAGSNPTPKQDLFQDEGETTPKAHKDKSLDSSLFDDKVDIFADLTATSKPKEKKFKKVETKSIFHDDMDDVFSPCTVKPMAKQPPSKFRKSPPSQDTSATDGLGNIFDDPLDALGGN